LEVEKAVFQEKNIDNAQKQRKLDNVLQQYDSLKKHLDNEKKNILNLAKLEAKELLKNANKKIELTIKEIKENKADSELTRDIRQQLTTFSESLVTDKVQKLEVPKSKDKTEDDVAIQVISGEIVVGSLVRIKGDLDKDSQAFGEVLNLRGKDAEVSMGALKMTIKLNRLEKISRKEFKKKSNAVGMHGIDLNEKMINFSFNLDLRGKRSEEAMMEVDSFMNDAIMLGYQELRIVHGKGDGILRTLIRNQLKGYSQVKKTTDEHADRGGAGVTIVTMN
jgi:DNA mismatch repair protein MutS2